MIGLESIREMTLLSCLCNAFRTVSELLSIKNCLAKNTNEQKSRPVSLPPAWCAYQTGVSWLILESLPGAHGKKLGEEEPGCALQKFWGVDFPGTLPN